MATVPDEIRIPDVVGEIVGWRAWDAVGTERCPRLQSVNGNLFPDDSAGSIWPTGRWFYARCPHGHTSDIPVEGCSCGLYAAAALDQLLELGYGSYGDLTDKVIGQVAFAGKVIPGTQGWKAERGRVLHLVVPFEKVWLGKALAGAYNVPLALGRWIGGGLRIIEC